MSLNPVSSTALQTAVVVTTLGFTRSQSTLRPDLIRTPCPSLAVVYPVTLLSSSST
ncbi:hypothetical protein BDV25DRAFT_161457 [Aspergillus avenaceus]|uniref:Uncharacterized protein n=1 Tax=Aspergillus avenaceus TaxID=36643 RepID=A0A5N6TKW1_ASPAV|nr:hypothetical protein BDV25DRAFT_161457 [Aspergillus avenaceus]